VEKTCKRILVGQAGKLSGKVIMENFETSCMKPSNHDELHWRLIDTAPKDGRQILLYGGHWSDDEVTDIKIGAARYDYKNNCWVVTSTEGGYSIVAYRNATHWMPLPDKWRG